MQQEIPNQQMYDQQMLLQQQYMQQMAQMSQGGSPGGMMMMDPNAMQYMQYPGMINTLRTSPNLI
jgi:hypothetical protein